VIEDLKNSGVAGGQARIAVTVSVEGVGELQAELLRFLAPMTVDEVVRKLPIEGFLAKWENAVYIVTDITRGMERMTQNLARGDIFYWPPGRALGISTAVHRARFQTVKVGRLLADPAELEKSRTGVRLRFLRR